MIRQRQKQARSRCSWAPGRAFFGVLQTCFPYRPEEGTLPSEPWCPASPPLPGTLCRHRGRLSHRFLLGQGLWAQAASSILAFANQSPQLLIVTYLPLAPLNLCPQPSVPPSSWWQDWAPRAPQGQPRLLTSHLPKEGLGGAWWRTPVIPHSGGLRQEAAAEPWTVSRGRPGWAITMWPRLSPGAGSFSKSLISEEVPIILGNSLRSCVLCAGSSGSQRSSFTSNY